MKKFLARFLLFLIFVPALILIIFKLNFWNFLLFIILVEGFSVLGTVEMRNFFPSKKELKPVWLLPVLGGSFVALGYAGLWFRSILMLPEIWLVVLILVILIKVTFFEAGDDFSRLYPHLTASLLSIIYPGLFLSYLIRICAFTCPAPSVGLFLGMVLGNDIFAYLGGRFMGGKTRLNLKISPNKSLVGFLSGIIYTIVFCVIFHYALPGFFTVNVWIVILFALLIALATIAGDLVESAMKRASGLKDSGKLMLGRGGVLDSIDSILISAPVFYFLFPLISG